MNRQQRRSQKAAAPIPPGTPNFTPQDISTVFAALQLFKNFNPEAGEDPAFCEVERQFMPNQTGTSGFHHSTRHVFYIFNSLTYLYGFASTGSAKLTDADGADLSASAAVQAADLLKRMYGWLGRDIAELPAKLASAQERARDLLEGMWADAGLINRQSAQS